VKDDGCTNIHAVSSLILLTAGYFVAL